MANALYPIWKGALLAGTTGNDLDNNTTDDGPYVALIDTNDVAYSAAHDFYNDISAAVVGTPVRITSPTVVAGVFDGADVTFSAVTGDVSEALIIYRHNSGANSTWPVVAYIDAGVTGLPITPNGGDINVVWNASGIFQL